MDAIKIHRQMNTILTNLNELEFKELLRQSVRDVLQENQSNRRPEPPDVLDIKAAAEFLKLKVSTLYEKTSYKQIPHFKKGNKLYFHRAELEAWIKSGRVKTRADIEGEALSHLMTRK